MPEQPSSFRSIRTWDGSQDRAFEELCYQLLGREGLPQDAKGPTRTGNPDGGVEWYADLANGTQWGWQAKFIWDIDDLLGGMNATVERVVLERPSLRRLIFCIPWNLPAGTAGGRRQSARQRYEAYVERWHTRLSGADSIEFHLIQGSDLLERLSKPEHAGRRLFWFNEHFLGFDELERLYERQRDIAGRRYRPDLQVDLPIEEDLRALGFGDQFFEELTELRRSFLDAFRYLRIVDTHVGDQVRRAFEAAAEASEVVKLELATMEATADNADPLAQLETVTSQAVEALNTAREAAFELERTLERSDASEEDKKRVQSLRSDAYYLWRVLDSAEDILSFVSSPRGQALRRRAYFLTGSAGTGKTHLLLDAARKALDEGRPAVVLFGAAFGRGGLWQTLSEELGVGQLGRDELLGAMAACAEAASLQGRRFVIAIDALNETTEPTFWAHQLPALRAAIAQWPLVSLVVSCRDTYVEAVDPDDRRATDFVVREHPGFAGREVEATHKYFLHYGLAEPRIPLLLPEFTVPLFLQLYCESLRDAGLDAPPQQHESRLQIFERFLQAKVARISQTLDPQASRFERDLLVHDVRAVLDGFTDACIRAGREGLPLAEVAALAQTVSLRSDVPASRVIGALERESVLTRDRLYMDDRRVDALRFTFQAFADYMILQRRLGEMSAADVKRDDDFRNWLHDASWGVVEAGAVVLPERFGIELPDYLEPLVRARAAEKEDDETLVESRLHFWLDETFLRTLPYRSARSITDRTIELLNRHLSHHHDGQQFFEVLFTLAPQPEHRLNGDGLHAYLSRFKLADRDAWFGQSVYRVLDDEGSAASRLARWAARGPYPMYDPQVVELACIPLVWLLSSPNRFMRDWTTKALVQLLRGHPDVLHRLLDHFATVDDPYVLERLVVVAYGSIMRRMESPTIDAWRPVVECISARIFGDLQRLVADALMLDAARGVVEASAVLGLATDDQLEQARPPYGLKRPGNPWTLETIKKRFYDLKADPERSYLSIYTSLFSLGDFGRYVVGSGVRHFARVPLTKPYPDDEPRAEKPRRVNKRKWAAFVRTLSDEQRARLQEVEEAAENDETAIRTLLAFRASLSAEQEVLLAQAEPSPPKPRRWRDTSYSTELANRWIFQRVVKLGWTPERFGSFDRYHVSSRGRESHKSERFGKKYQWIAYHELLARVADNFHLERLYDDLREYDGLYQIHDRDIDPSLPPIPFAEFIGERREIGSGLPVAFIRVPSRSKPDFTTYRQNEDAFYDDQESLPLAERIFRVFDDDGQPWIVLDGNLTARDPDPSDEEDDFEGPRALEQWSHLTSWLVPLASVQEACWALLDELERGWSSDLVDRHGHVSCCYLGEMGWRPTRCPHRRAGSVNLDLPDADSTPLYFTAEDYTAEGNGFDCSIRDSFTITCPSAFIQQAAGLRWSKTDSTWAAGSETVVAYTGTRDWYRDDLLVAKEEWLSAFLAEHDLALILGSNGERRHLMGRETYARRWLDYYSVAALTYEGTITGARHKVIDHTGEAEEE